MGYKMKYHITVRCRCSSIIFHKVDAFGDAALKCVLKITIVYYMRHFSDTKDCLNTFTGLMKLGVSNMLRCFVTRISSIDERRQNNQNINDNGYNIHFHNVHVFSSKGNC